MSSITLDTGPLADLLAQYFGPAQRGHAPFQRGGSLTEEAVRAINAIVRAFIQDEPARALVFASTLAFAEIARKWDALSGGRFQPHQLRAFLANPPGWFAVDPVDDSLVEFFLQVPIAVQMGGKLENIEWTDALHVATALSHDAPRAQCLLACEDRRVRAIPQLAGRCL
jgi:hypothetical protein